MTSNEPDNGGGVVSHVSPYGIDDTLRRLELVIRDHGLTLFAHFDHGGEAAKAGLIMHAAHVLVFGNPTAGTPLMVASPLIALELPLKALVWQDDRGQVWVSYQRPMALAQRYAIPPELVRVLAGVEGVVEAAVR